MAHGVIPKKIPGFVKNSGKVIQKSQGWNGIVGNMATTRQAHRNLADVLAKQLDTGRIKHAEVTVKEISNKAMPESEVFYYANDALHRLGVGKRTFASRAEAIKAVQDAAKDYKKNFETELGKLAEKFKYIEINKKGEIVFTNRRRWFRFLRNKQITINKEVDKKTGKVKIKGFKVKGWF